MLQPPFPSTNAAQPCHVIFFLLTPEVQRVQATVSRYIFDHKNHGHGKLGERRSHRLTCLEKPVLAQREGGHGGGGGAGNTIPSTFGGSLALRAHCVLLFNYVPPEGWKHP